MKNIQETLIDWYQFNHREFPWRINQDPYRIWISEIMLQQTTTEAVIPYYLRFLKKFPQIQDLAKASLEDVYKMWEGLGYYRRAKYLHETAQFICEKYQGVFPTKYQDILSLKGVGEYTAGAICSIAYHQPTPAIDGNVLRIMARVELIQDNIADKKTQKEIHQVVSKLLKGYDASSFNQGLMDLGATICRPVHPRCESCPIQMFCKAYKKSQQDVLPIHIKKIKHQELNYITAIITYHNQFLLVKKPAGLLENMYGFIQFQLESPYSFLEQFEEQFGKKLKLVSYIQDVKHVFTHRTWYMHVYHFIIDEPIENLYSYEQLQQLPISTAHSKVLKAYFKYQDGV